jgi:hypothetical protein
MKLLDEIGILNLTNYNKDFVWREHREIIPKIKGFNIKGYKYGIDFIGCNIFNENGFDVLDLSKYNGNIISFAFSNIKFKEINVRNNKGEISFLGTKIKYIKHLNLSNFNGKKIKFENSEINFDKINIVNNKAKIDFNKCKKLKKELRKEFDLSKSLEENIELIYYFDKETLEYYKNDLIKLHKKEYFNLTKLKH